MAPLNEITIALEEMRSRGHSSSWVDPGNHWCLTLEAQDSTANGPPFWIQVQAATLNMQYLDEDDPIGRLSEEVSSFPRDLELVAWEPALYATFGMPLHLSSGLPSLIDRIVREYFALQPTYQLSYSLEDHA